MSNQNTKTIQEVQVNSDMIIFEDKHVRRKWHNEQSARKYWNKLSERLKNEVVDESVTKCYQLKLQPADGKFYLTDCANVKGGYRVRN